MSVVVLLSLGIVFVVMEIFFASFFLLFIGIGLLGTAALEYFVGLARFGDIYIWQAMSICAISLLSFIMLKKPLQQRFKRSQTYSDIFDEAAGIGEIREGMVDFKGTLWAYEYADAKDFQPLDQSPQHQAQDSSQNPPAQLRNGSKVKILAIKNSKAIIATPSKEHLQNT